MGDFITRAEILQEISRELAIRREVFPRWVKDGKLKQEEADKCIARMQAGYDFIVNNMPDNNPQKGMFK
jgi:hypothetical protein